MSPSTNNWRKKRSEHRFYVEIVFMWKSQRTSQRGTQSVKTHNRTTQKKLKQ
jgi:hypothetical protein